MVLDKGFMVEFDTPQALLAQQGIYYKMARDAGLAWEAGHVMTITCDYKLLSQQWHNLNSRIYIMLGILLLLT